VEDRDMAACLPMLILDGAAVSDEALLRWLDGSDANLEFVAGNAPVKVERIIAAELPRRFGFVANPT